MQNRFTPEALTMIRNAMKFATDDRAGEAESQHLLMALVSDPSANLVYLNAGVTPNALQQILLQAYPSKGKKGSVVLGKDLEKVLEKAFQFALQMTAQKLITTDLLGLALVREKNSHARRCLEMLAVDTRKLEQSILLMLNEETDEEKNSPADEPELAYSGVVSSGKKDQKASTKMRKGSVLEQLAFNMSRAAANNELDPVIGRDVEVERVLQILSRKTKNNPILVGEPGVGKTAIIEGLAQRLLEDHTIPESLRSRQVWSLDLGAVIAGTRYRGDFEQRLLKLIQEVQTTNAILFIDEIHAMITAGGGEGSVNAANIMKPVLARGELQTIGATTYDEYRKHVEKDAAMARRFQKVDVNEPSISDAIRILQGIRPTYEEHHKITITDSALEAAVKLSARYITSKFLPDKAIDLVDEAGAKARIQQMNTPEVVKKLEEELTTIIARKTEAISQEDFFTAAAERAEETRVKKEIADAVKTTQEETTTVTITDKNIADILHQSTGIPVNTLTSDLSRYMVMEDELNKEIIGQTQAVEVLAKAIRRQQAGLKDPKRPAGSFVFAGQSGVGKTETVKALTRFLFHDEDALISFDMSEYGEKNTVSRLFGAPPGYVGYDEGGQLTERVRRKPYSVILFDEIEKAHPDLFNTLLQVLEEGRLTDGQGRVVDFKNTIIVFTTNLEAGKLSAQSTGFQVDTPEHTYQVMHSKVMSEMKQNFRPEFLNRLDEIVVFTPLSKEALYQIINLFTTKLNERLEDSGYTVQLTDAMKDHLINVGYDQSFGARPLRRSMQNVVEDGISELILFNVPTNKHVVVDYKDGVSTFNGLTRDEFIDIDNLNSVATTDET